MAKVSSTQFIELAYKSQLADAKAIDECVAELKSANDGQLPDDPVEVARHLRKQIF